MATNPKMKPCPECRTDEHLDIFTYDNGWRHVECVKCNYLGPGEGTIRQAIKSHNAQSVDVAALNDLAPPSNSVIPCPNPTSCSWPACLLECQWRPGRS